MPTVIRMTDKDAESDTKDTDERDNSLVAIGHDSTLASGKRATAVVSVLGSSTSAGEVDEAVVSVLGNTHVTGPVGDAAVAVFGNTYVDSRVGDAVVAVFGNVELGPHADVHGDVVAIGGDLIKDPAAVVHGNIQNVLLFGHMGNYEWLRTWVHNCLMYGRPLALVPGLGWAWTMAVSFLVVYLLIALLFPAAVNQCVRTMETSPGRTTLTSLFTFICKPIVFLLLLVTVIGSILIPFLGFALFMAGLFGKSVALAWLGRRALPSRDSDREYPPVVAVLVGGLMALVLYVVPVLGFIAYKALDVLGLGIVIYTLVLILRARRAAVASPQAAAASTASPLEGVAAGQGSPEASADAAAAQAPPAGRARSTQGIPRTFQSCRLLDSHWRFAARSDFGGDRLRRHSTPDPPRPAADSRRLWRGDVETARHHHRRNRVRLACGAPGWTPDRLANGSHAGAGQFPVTLYSRAGIYLGGVRPGTSVLARQDRRYRRGTRAAGHAAGLNE